MCDGGTLTVMPSMLDGRSSAVSDYGVSTTNDTRMKSQITSEPLFPWQDHHQSTHVGQASYTSQFGTSYATSQPQTLKEEDATQARWGTWADEPRRLPAFPFISSLFPENGSFQSNDYLSDAVSSTSSTPYPSLPLPFRSHPRSHWTESPTKNILHDTRTASQSQSPPFPPYDAADHMGPSLYSTAPNLHASRQLGTKRFHQDFEDDMIVDNYETDGESIAKNEPPYAKLIYQALMAAPRYRMVLRDIYDWIGRNTDKAKDPAFKGWQNSVRHNLSMNGVRL